MAQTENQNKLLKILNAIFQLDQSDLDFGIYRIMNTKSKEINDFLDNDLLSSVANAFRSNDNNSIQKMLDDKVNSFREDGFSEEQIDNNVKIIALREQLSSSSTSANLENDVFSHLANFFKRYYKDGDFVSLRRYKKDTYAIPYEGEEVKLHWANSDQYYIKSGKYFRDYTFVVNDKTIHLKLSDAETECNNNKATSDKERRFIILENNPCEVINDELFINFEYKAIGKENQDKLNEKAIAKALESVEGSEFSTALETPAPTEKNKNRTIFEKHLKSYTSRNSFDYFIHKDLGGFLGRELDFYIKNEMLFLDDIMDSSIKYDEVMGKVKIFKEVSSKIISFLTQLEELQKKLWEKKKFIIETNYCITLDKIEEKHYSHILGNDEQKTEWKTLFDIDIKSIEDLKKEKYLVLDTKFFDTEFKYKLLSAFDNLDDDIDGILINSENFGALNLLQDRYKEQIKTVYIDPPYNTGNDGFLYNDNYKHSSWMSFITDRLLLSHKLQNKNAIAFTSLDSNEIREFQLLVNSLFGSENNLSLVSVINNMSGRSDDEYFATSNEFLSVIAKDEKSTIFNGIKRQDFTKYKYEDDISKYSIEGSPLRKTGKNSRRIDRPNLHYPIYISPDNKNLGLKKNEGWIEIFPIDSKGIERSWTWEKSTFENKKDTEIHIHTGRDGSISLFKKDRYKELEKPKTIMYKKDYSSTTGTKILEDLIPSNNMTNPKALSFITDILIISGGDIILDYFAGSGTTGHSVINLNREDNERRKYILVEMGEYFDTVTKPRIQKVIYSDDWKDGKPTTKNGISQIFKYFKLESYEDSLNNLEFKRTKEQQKTLDFHEEAKEDYILNYSLDVESQGSLLNIATFKTPFDYKLKIATSSVGETKDTAIDLVETFNYLLGLVVRRIELLKGYLVIEGQNLKKEKILIIWRDGQSSDELNEFFKKMDWSVYDREFDTIYVNGDNNLDNLRKDEDHFKVKLIEQEFKNLMFKGN